MYFFLLKIKKLISKYIKNPCWKLHSCHSNFLFFRLMLRMALKREKTKKLHRMMKMCGLNPRCRMYRSGGRARIRSLLIPTLKNPQNAQPTQIRTTNHHPTLTSLTILQRARQSPQTSRAARLTAAHPFQCRPLEVPEIHCTHRSPNLARSIT